MVFAEIRPSRQDRCTSKIVSDSDEPVREHFFEKNLPPPIPWSRTKVAQRPGDRRRLSGDKYFAIAQPFEGQALQWSFRIDLEQRTVEIFGIRPLKASMTLQGQKNNRHDGVYALKVRAHGKMYMVLARQTCSTSAITGFNRGRKYE
jgi:hypothetical protein